VQNSNTFENMYSTFTPLEYTFPLFLISGHIWRGWTRCSGRNL